MDSRRLVVWISAGILGFQCGTLVLDLIHCSVLSWLYVRRYGLELVVPNERVEQKPPEGLGRLEAISGATHPSQAKPLTQPQNPAPTSASQPSSPRPSPRGGAS
jgi:hypothetical protein